MRTIDKIITKVDCKYGAPMGRSSIFPKEYLILGSGDMRKRLVNYEDKTDQTIFDCKVPMIDGAYDKGGAYWGLGAELRVAYTKDLTYVHFYRVHESALRAC